MLLVQLCLQTADLALRQSGVLQGDALGLGGADVALVLGVVVDLPVVLALRLSEKSP